MKFLLELIIYALAAVFLGVAAAATYSVVSFPFDIVGGLLSGALK